MVRLHRRGGSTPPLLGRMGLFNIIEEAPAGLLVTDADGDIAYRNKAMVDLMRRFEAEHGENAVRAAWEAVQALLRTGHSHPHRQAVTVDAGGKRIELVVRLSPVPGGYLVSWQDVTVERERVEVWTRAADRLADTSVSFGEVSSRLNADTAVMSERAGKVASGAEQLSSSIGEIAVSAGTAAADTNAASEAAVTATGKITQLTESMLQIGTVSKLIDAIAAQTNLLALNATIESARAGEAGKGFAVVAGEVKELAHRTSQATGQISEMISAIRADAADVAAAIEQIATLIRMVAAEQTTIAGAVEEQAITTAEISSGMLEVASAIESTGQAVTDLGAVGEALSENSRQIRGGLIQEERDGSGAGR
jgi:hypothetical protein